MASRTRKTISQNPLDDISTRAKPADTPKKAAKAAKDSKVEKVVRPRKKHVSPNEVAPTDTSNAASAATKTVSLSDSAEKDQLTSSPVQTRAAKTAFAKAAGTTQSSNDVKHPKAATGAETAEQLLAAEIARSPVPMFNRDEELVMHHYTPVKVLEQPGGLNPPIAVAALPSSYLTAEDVFQNELSRARVSLKAEATRTKLAAQKIVTRWSRWSVAVSFIPTPFVDMAAISGVQVKMIYDLCKLYKVDFEHTAAVAIASGVAGGAATQTLAGVLAKQMARFAPGIGPIMMFAIEPSISYVTSKAIGAVFISHFEANGRMHDFQPEKVRQYIAEQIEKRRSRFKDKTVQAQA